MAIVAMADAVPGAIASSAEYNKLIDNIIDLDSRVIESQDIFAKYYRTSNQSNAIVAGVWTKQAYDVSLETHADVSADAGFDDWTLNKAGIWEIHASNRAGVTNVDPMRYQIGIFPTSSVVASSAYNTTTWNEPLASANSTNMEVFVRRRFTAGSQICVAIIRSGNSGGGGGNNASTEAMGEINQISFKWIGP
jgi:hypothetical protein